MSAFLGGEGGYQWGLGVCSCYKDEKYSVLLEIGKITAYTGFLRGEFLSSSTSLPTYIKFFLRMGEISLTQAMFKNKTCGTIEMAQ